MTAVEEPRELARIPLRGGRTLTVTVQDYRDVRVIVETAHKGRYWLRCRPEDLAAAGNALIQASQAVTQ